MRSSSVDPLRAIPPTYSTGVRLRDCWGAAVLAGLLFVSMGPPRVDIDRAPYRAIALPVRNILHRPASSGACCIAHVRSVRGKFTRLSGSDLEVSEPRLHLRFHRSQGGVAAGWRISFAR